jgi:hypothetical protein
MKSPLTVSELINAVVPCREKVDRDDTFRVAKVLPSCVERNVVLTKLAKLAVEIKRAKLAVETKLAKLAVETKLAKLAVETKLAKLAVETKLAKLAVETMFARLAVLIIEPNTTVER